MAGNALCLIRLRNYEGARAALDSALVSGNKSVGEGAQLARVYYVYGLLNDFTNKPDQSLTMHTRGLEMRKKILGEEHFDVSDYLQGSIQILKPVVKSANNGESNVVFSPVIFASTQNKYELSDASINLPLEFQLVAKGFRQDSYLYVISFDKDLKPAVHWPRDEKLNRKFVDETESARMTAQHSTITLPAKYQVFTLSQPGTEYLCVLNSNKPIKDISDRLRQVGTMKGDVSARIQKAFNTMSPDDYSSLFAHEHINFYARGGKSDVVSILLQFQMGK